MIAEYCLVVLKVVLPNASLTSIVGSRVAGECSVSADGKNGVSGIDNTCGGARLIVITAFKLTLSSR